MIWSRWHVGLMIMLKSRYMIDTDTIDDDYSYEEEEEDEVYSD